LQAEALFGPFYYNAPDQPELVMLSHPEGITGSYPENHTEALEEGEYFMELNWDATDSDGDNITYSLHYKKTSDTEWKLIKDGMDNGYFEWNISSLHTGEYQLRIVAKDSSEKALRSEMIMGPFSWFNVYTDIIDDDSDDDTTDDDQEPEEEEDDMDWVFFVIIAIVSVVAVILIVIISLFIASRISKKEDTTNVIPQQSDMDYTAIPEFERNAPYRSPQTQQDTPQPAPGEVPSPQLSSASVNWEEEEGEEVDEILDEAPGEDIQSPVANSENIQEDVTVNMTPPPVPPQ
jgi:hypothetical protein